MTFEKTIIAIGGAGFYKSDLILEQYILQQSQRENPRVLFLPTASGDSGQYVMWFYQTFNQLPCKPTHLSLFNMPSGTLLEQTILNQDIIYVGGGNTKNMLALWREWGIDVLLRTAWERGIVLAGSSAGSLCWFEEGVTDSLPSGLSIIKGLGFLPGSNCPHYNDEPERRLFYHNSVVTGRMVPGIAQDQCVALHYKNRELYKILTSKQGQQAYRVQTHPRGGMAENELAAELISAH